MQFGRVDIKFKRELAYNNDGTPKMAKTREGKQYHAKEPSANPLDLGNDLKAATTDALKKCAAELGIAADVYAPNEYKEIKLISEKPKATLEEIKLLMQIDGLTISEEDRMNIEYIIEKQETSSYQKCIDLLNSNLPKTKN